MISWYELLFYAAYGIPLFTINAKVTYILWIKRKQFTSSYYRIYFLCSLNDCILYLTSNFLIRLSSVELFYDIYYSKFLEPSFHHTPISFLNFYCSYLTTVGTFLLSFNRLTAVWMYHSYEVIWRRFITLTLSISMAVVFAFTFSGLFTAIAFKHTVVGNTSVVLLNMKQLISLWNINTVNAWTVGIFTFSGFVVNATTLTLWKRQRSRIPGCYQQYHRRLLFLTIVVYSLHFLSFCYNALKTLFLTNPASLYRSYGIITDLISLIPNFAFVIVSPTLQREIFPRWLRNGCWKRFKPSTVDVTSNNSD